MKAHHIMTHHVITIDQDATLADAAQLMLANHFSGLPVVDAKGELVGIVTERDFLRRQELDTQRKRPRWLELILGPGRMAEDYVKTAGRKVREIMTRNLYTAVEETPLAEIVQLMETHHIKRVPIMRGKKIVGMVTRQNFVQAVSSLSRGLPEPTPDDTSLRRRILATIEDHHWAPIGINAIVRNGVVDLCGVITDEHVRQAIVVATENVPGVEQVHDHLAWVDPMSGIYLLSPEDDMENPSRQAKAS
ncbi:MAG: CBS domain-containing protein [Candidatus Afipia apatlaquensis]|uniref:CBS domain-containing protein n=1 Tax=Candidatus Afipia apatlaquensis TaxID=2712852 RepID=A0A7C9RG43_9BRAD|nr:CBS domain-containing protein [Candidatus Afipia apatlaquensis]